MMARPRKRSLNPGKSIGTMSINTETGYKDTDIMSQYFSNVMGINGLLDIHTQNHGIL